MPEMSVVRFEEIDVICASNRITLNRFGNKVNGDGYVRYMGTNYGSNQQAGDLSVFYARFNSDHNTGIDGTTSIGFETEGGSGFINFNGALTLDNSSSDSPVDGTYVWNGSMFDRFGNQ